MAQRELDIIAKARTILNDVTEPYRWADSRLMQLLSEGQEDMCINIPMVTAKATINTSGGVAEYHLPDNSVKLLRASSNGNPLHIASYEDIEAIDFDWEEATGHAVVAIVVNALSQQTIRPYPLTQDTQVIKVRYHALPVTLGWNDTTKDSEQELSVASMWDDGLKQYVVAQAFLDYGDESSASRASMALGLYKTAFGRALKLSKKSFSKRALTTKFQGRVVSTRYMGGRYGSGNCGFRY